MLSTESQFPEDPSFKAIPHAEAPGLPEGVDGSRYEWADIDGEGIAGVLSKRDGAWWYAPNRWAVIDSDNATPPNA